MADPLDDIRLLFERLPGPNEAAVAGVRARDAQLTKPSGALGRLEDLAAWAAAWQGGTPLHANPIQVLVFAGNHGVAARGVSAYPPEVTAQMVANFAAGGAAINQLSAVAGVELSVHGLDLDRPTADFTQAPAMTGEDCAAAFHLGMEKVSKGTALVCVGEMGIGNTTSAGSLCAALFGGDGAQWAGPGTGLPAEGVSRKASVIDEALTFHQSDLADPLEVLRRLGGRELAAMAGAVLAARLAGVPVMLDGFVSCAAAAILAAVDGSALDHCRAAHRSAEPGHTRLLEALGQTPLLDLGMRLGEASGAALAANIFRAAIETHNGMATFSDAGVSGRDDP